MMHRVIIPKQIGDMNENLVNFVQRLTAMLLKIV